MALLSPTRQRETAQLKRPKVKFIAMRQSIQLMAMLGWVAASLSAISSGTATSNQWPGYLPPGDIVPHQHQTNVVDAESANVAAGVIFGQPNEGLRMGTAIQRITNTMGVAIDATLVLQNLSPGEKYYLFYGENEPYELYLLTPDSQMLSLIPTEKERRKVSRHLWPSISISSSNQVVTEVVLPLGAAVATNGNYTFLAVAKIPKGRDQNEADVRGENQLIEITADDLAQIRKLAPSNLPPAVVLGPASGGPSFVMPHSSPKLPAGSPNNASPSIAPPDEKCQSVSFRLAYLSVCILVIGTIVWLYLRRRASSGRVG